jgi:hypothetical protein
MALTVQLVNSSYGYQAGGSVSYNATLELKSNGVTLATTGLSYSTSFLVAGWADRIKAACQAQAQEYITQFQYIMNIANSVYPTATTPQEACDALTAELSATITI